MVKLSGIRPFLEGFAHVFDLFGVLGSGFLDPNEDGFKKDREAIGGDWRAVLESYTVDKKTKVGTVA